MSDEHAGDGAAEGDRGDVGREPQGDDFAPDTQTRPSEQNHEEQPEPVTGDTGQTAPPEDG